MRKLLVGCLWVQIVTLPLVALSHEFTPPEHDDWQRWIDADTTVQMLRNASKAIDTLDDRIDDLLAELFYSSDSYRDSDRELLASNQRAWRDYAKSKSAFLANKYAGGSLRPLAELRQFVDEQLARIEELREMHEHFTTP